MAKDRIGNELAAGHLVEVKLDSPAVVGKIKQISDGGLSLAGTAPGAPAQMSPGVITIIAEIPVLFHPNNPQAPNVLRLVDPDENQPKIVQ